MSGAARRRAGGHFDLAHAEKLLSGAGTAARNGDRETSARLFRAARLLLREEPLAGLQGSWAETQRAKLLELYENRAEELAGVLNPEFAGSRMRVHVSGGGSSDREVFTAGLGARRTGTESLLTDHDPVEAVRRLVEVAEQRWPSLRGVGPATVRIVLAGTETDEAVLDEIAAALSADQRPWRRLLLAFPLWARGGANVHHLLSAQVPGHERWVCLEVVAGRFVAPQPREDGGFFDRLFGRPKEDG